MKKKYWISGLIVAAILLLVFSIKGIYPFGNNYIIWGDMYEQIVALYYNFYDVVFNGKSIMVDYSAGIASNLLANFSYYIVSPFTLIVLLFERCDIPNAVSIIVLLKIVVSAVTCNYFLDKKFEKLDDFYKCFFSIIYALSTYNLSMYIITGWIDIVYLFPLLMVGLDKLLNTKRPTMFIIILTMSLIFNFYISLICIIFIFFISLIYLKVYKKENIKQVITSLGISVVLSLLISSIVLVPVFMQILSSARIGFNFSQLSTSKFGPIIDKLIFLTSSMATIVCTLFLLVKYKDNKKNINFVVLSLSLVGLPLLIEPINKMWHFGSYVSYPYRYGFILLFLLVIASCMYLNIKEEDAKEHKALIIISTLIITGLVGIISYKYYPMLQESVNKLSFSFNRKSFLVMALLSFLNLIPYFIIFKFGDKSSNFSKSFLMVNLLVFSFVQSVIYINIDSTSKEFRRNYEAMNYISTLETEPGYHFKQENANMISNSGAITNKATQDYFTSLTDNNMFIEYQKLGYNSYWMDISSSGSNYFIDFILSNKYFVTKSTINDEFYKLYTTKDDLNIYESKLPISKGYILSQNKSIKAAKNSFEATNIIYQALSNTTINIVDIYEQFELENLTYNGKKINIVDKTKEAYISKVFNVNGEKTLYLEMFTSYLNLDKNKLYGCFDIYVNGNLLEENFYNKNNNASLKLGTFTDEKIEVKIVVKKDVTRNVSISFGLLDRKILKEYFEGNMHNINLEYEKNNINVSYESNNKGDILFIPVPYLNGMNATSNNKSVEIVKVFDNFIGIELLEGPNDIKISYTTPGLKLGIILTITGLMLSLLFLKFYDYIIKIKIIHKIAYIVYLILYGILVFAFYVVPLFMFVFSLL